jgi:anti-anti-sigma factor
LPREQDPTDVAMPFRAARLDGPIAGTSGVAFVTLGGEMDVASAPGMLRESRAALQRGARRLVLDLTAVTFADSTALAGLIQCRRVAYRAGADLVTVCPEGPVRHLIELTGLHAVLSLARTRAEAVARP